MSVKPLEWKQTGDGRYLTGLRPDHFTAENYTVHRVSRGWVIDDGRFTFLRKIFGSFEEAAETAQNHWAERIRSALSTPTHGVQLIDAETAILYFLVEKLGGHQVRIVRPGVGSMIGFSISNRKTIAIRDLIDLILRPSASVVDGFSERVSSAEAQAARPSIPHEP